jgi:flagellar biosynthesis/type III secretory pathway protein FliH
VKASGVRIIRSGDAPCEPLFTPGPSAEQRRRIVREELEATLAAEALVAEARATAESLVERAREEARKQAEAVAREAREEASAKLAAQWLALRSAEIHALARETDRVVALAVALAERLIGSALRLEPTIVADLARTVLAEAQGARRAVIRAHPLDADELRGHLSTAGLDLQTVEFQNDETLERGELKLHTDIGIIDAKLAPRLARLAEALRDALR